MSVLAEPSGVNEPITQADISTSARPVADPKYTDEAALRIVQQDYESSEAWLTNHSWSLQWRESKILYQSPRTLAAFEGSSVTRSNVSRFTVAKQVNSLAPTITGAIFSDATPFEVTPRPREQQNTAYAWKHLLTALLDECDFKAEMGIAVESMVNQGTVIMKCGMESKTVIEKHRIRKAAPVSVDMPMGAPPVKVITKESTEFEVKEEEVTHTRPWIEKCELGSVFIDPKWNKPNQLWKARWIIHKDYVTYDDLKVLSQSDDYDIPDEATLRDLLFGDQEQTATIGAAEEEATETSNLITSAAARDEHTSEDPLEKPMMILERWTEDRCMVTLQGKVVIRNNRHSFPDKPFFAANFWNCEDTGYGMGVGRISGADQRVDQGTINAALDIISMAVNPEYLVSRGANASTQDMRQRLGGIRLVDGDPRAAFTLKEQPKVPADVWTVTQLSREASESATGADQATVQGALPGPKSSFGKSGTGAGILGKASSGRIQAPLDRVVDGIMLPFVYFVIEMVLEFMPMAEIKEILDDVESKDFEVDMNSFMNPRLKLDVLAGTRLAARQAMSQALPFLLQVFENPALIQQLNTTGYKIDAMQLVGMVMDVSEWKNGRQIVVPMSPEEKQAQQQSDPGAQKAQQASQMLQQKHQNDMELESQKIQGRLVADTVKHATAALGQSPIDRAANFAERDQMEHTMNNSQYFGGQ